jgi:hypothetical protein
MVNRSRPALRPKRNAITCTRQPRFLIPVFAWLLSFSFSVGLLLPSPQAVWAQAYTVIPYEDEVNP